MSGSYYGFTSGGTQYGSVGTYPVAQAAFGTTPTAPGTAPTAPAYPAVYGTNYSYPTAPGATHQTQNTSGAAYGFNAGASFFPPTGSTAAPSALPAVVSQVPNLGQQQVKPQNNAATAPAEGTTYTGYDAALYAAAKSYLASKSTGNTSQWMSMKKNSAGVGGPNAPSYTNNSGVTRYGGGGGFGGRGSFARRGGGSAGTNYRSSGQVHYCEVCKISCGALQTYREHLEGRMHKKKEAMLKSGPENPARSKSSFYCEICEVLCTGADTYQSHVRGSKHQKTIKLHQQLGKPLPSQEAKVIPPIAAASTNGQQAKKVVVVQKTNFIGGEKLHSTGVIEPATKSASASEMQSDNVVAIEENDVQPVGEDYLELIKIENGRVTAYNCKLCDCQFTDMGAKDMHMKGRRHRLNYKKKVNPDLEVDVKIHPRARRQLEEKTRKDLMKMRQQDIYTMRAMYQSQMTVPTAFGNTIGSRPSRMALKDTENDRYIMTKHGNIYPTTDECAAAVKFVVAIEKALKGVSDHFDEESKKVKSEEQKLSEGGMEERLLKGVMRVGDLAKQLMLKGDAHLELVVLCSECPTATLLRKTADILPGKFEDQGEKYEIVVSNQDAALILIKSQICVLVVQNL
uniref:DZF domain-containing protein n=1 Tax=Romanomermis culicivorax TaxID=13658 RepID=A0A915IKG5_ROMCU